MISAPQTDCREPRRGILNGVRNSPRRRKAPEERWGGIRPDAGDERRGCFAAGIPAVQAWRGAVVIAIERTREVPTRLP